MSQPLYSPTPQPLVVSPDGAQEYLGRMGIDVSAIRKAIERGERRAVETSGPEYPRTGAGLGSSDVGPRAQRRKGPATDEALSDQLTLFVRAELTAASPSLDLNDEPPAGVWLLVYHRGEFGVQVELSYPNGSEDGQITGWGVRVLLPPFIPTEAVDAPDDIGGGDVGFDVTLAS